MRYLTPTLFLLFFFASAVVHAGDDKTDFLRIGRDDRGRAMTLDTAIVRYQKDDVPVPTESVMTVDLIGAVHVADRQYFKALNKQFEEYDVLLYELVAPKGTRPTPGKTDPDNPAHIIQDMLKTFLGLEHQLSCIDYTKDNMIHADLSPAELFKKMDKRGDTFFTIFLSTMAESMRQQNLSEKKTKYKNPKDIITDEELLAGIVEAMLTERGSPTLRRFLALQFGEDPTEQLKAFGGPLGQLLISDRNKAVMTVLNEQMEKGKVRVGVFYGAGHLPDLEVRLKKLGFKKKSSTWLSAWQLR